ncbi:hypothetical protein CI102_5996 [Trichoderma harzianum]|nr:hypothetical protein CI102_5996 [Trichoderma harzianum]
MLVIYLRCSSNVVALSCVRKQGGAANSRSTQYGTCTLLTDLYLKLHCFCTLSPALAVGRYKSSLAVPPNTPSKYLCFSSRAQPIRCLRSNARIDPRHDCSPTALEDCVSRKSHEQTRRFVPLHCIACLLALCSSWENTWGQGMQPAKCPSSCMCLVPTGSKVRVQVLVQYIRWLVNPHISP